MSKIRMGAHLVVPLTDMIAHQAVRKALKQEALMSLMVHRVAKVPEKVVARTGSVAGRP